MRHYPDFSHYSRIFSEDFSALPRDAIKSSGYVVDTLEAALWCLLTTDTYRDCEETLKLIAEGKLDTELLITHTYPLAKIDEAYELFENKRDGVIKVAVEC